jgi:hypothetical protein
MNLTYEDGYTRSNEQNWHNFAGVPRVLNSSCGCRNQSLGGFFSDVFDTLKSVVKAPIDLLVHGPGAAKDDLHAARSGIEAVGASVLGPAGALVSIFYPPAGAAMVLAGKKLSADKDAASALSAMANAGIPLVQKYQSLAGSMAGRFIPIETLANILLAWVDGGGFPPLNAANSHGLPVVDSFNGCLQNAVKAGLARGATAAQDIYDHEWQSTCTNPEAAWMRGVGPQFDPKGTEKQFTIDWIDNIMSQINPNLPMSYGATSMDVTPAVQPALPAPAPAPLVPIQQAMPLPAQPIFTVSAPPAPPAPPTVAQPLARSGVGTSTANQLNAMLQAMQQQGANQQQMFAAAMQQLQSSGVNTQTPQVQQAVGQAVTAVPQTAGVGNVSPWLVAGLGGVALIFALARPASRKKNPRRRGKR